MSRCDFKELIELQQRLQQAQQEVPILMEDIAKDIAKEFLQQVIERTPASNINKLKKDWKCDFNVIKKGSSYIVTIKNENEIASMIEYGHKNESNGWVNGRFMMLITENQINAKIDSITQPKVNQFLERIFK